MKDWPTDPIRQHNRFVQEVCDDFLETGTLSLFGPRASAAAEISRQVNEKLSKGAEGRQRPSE